MLENILLCEKKDRDKTCFLRSPITSNRNKNNHPKQIPHVIAIQKKVLVKNISGPITPIIVDYLPLANLNCARNLNSTPAVTAELNTKASADDAPHFNNCAPEAPPMSPANPETNKAS